MGPRKSSRRRKKTAAEEAKIAHGPSPLPNVSSRVEGEVARLSKKIRLYARQDIIEQRVAVERMIVEGAGPRQIWRVLRTMKDEVTKQLRWPNITLRTVQLRIEQVCAEREEEIRLRGKNEVNQAREYMIERLQNTRQKAMLANDFKAVVACEKEIAKLKGLYAPTKVEVEGNMQHSHAMMAVIASMDTEQATQLLEEAKTEKRLAEQARVLLPSLVVDTASEKG